LVKLAEQSGVDGVVASPQEAERIRAAVANRKLLIVTPGIRPAENNTGADDQRRVSTPAAALAAGADYLVVGRPITAAADPVAAARDIASQMERAQAAATNRNS
jgi:orotidine-5'-phosphate decarboxylase